MEFTGGRLLRAALIVSVFMQMHMTASVYAAGRPKMAFSSTRDGDSEIYVMDSKGGNPLRLMHDPAWNHEPAWPPGGRKIAFGSSIDLKPSRSATNFKPTCTEF
ncbi:MAG: hypothetical protein OXN17_18400 [Candidatus Poribacteria bacterium]|nr:hypothetical protein [Candidatus Poribacteria bacterium]MDE0504735.1 hypothetical protein [Candidatus Poribacteria bacterium]